jgi:hypothetical protein
MNFMKRNKIIPVLVVVSLFSTSFLSHTGNKKALAAYEVKFTFIGYIELYGDKCHVNDTGKVILRGVLEGNEKTAPDDPVLYIGTLQLSIHIDICSAKREANGEDKFCVMNVNGSGPVKVELEIDESAGYGYIKFKYDASLGQFQRSVNGSCDQLQMTEEQKMIPNETIAAIFNGLQLDMLSGIKTLGQLQLNKEYSDKMEYGIVNVQVLRKVR